MKKSALVTTARQIAFLATAVAASACSSAPTDGAATDVAVLDEPLYQRGGAWPGGVVRVCLDTLWPDNPALTAQARTILANTWERAANVRFVGWDHCPTTALYQFPPESVVALHFRTGTNGKTSTLGRPSVIRYGDTTGNLFGFCAVNGLKSPCYAQGVTYVEIISDDADVFQQQFRYEVIHEFGHALAFSHEQERPDNWTSGGSPIYCNQVQDSRKGIGPGVYLTSSFDYDSIMDYCAEEPLIRGLPTQLSAGDINGARALYGRNNAAHGFMIQSDRNPGLAVNAWGGAAEQTVLRLHEGCTSDNPDCTFSYRLGMLVSDRDPTLAINAWGGAAEGTVLKLTRFCTPSNPDCTWTYRNGMFSSDRDQNLKMNAWLGAVHGATVLLNGPCSPSNPDCTWQLPHVMLSGQRNLGLGVHPVGGASYATSLELVDSCTVSNPDCTWTFRKGRILNDRDQNLAINAFGGAADFNVVRLHNSCPETNPDCTWTWSHGQIISDNGGGSLPLNAWGGDLNGAGLLLNATCNAGNPDCVFTGLFAGN